MFPASFIIAVNPWHRFIAFEQLLFFIHGHRWFRINAFLFFVRFKWRCRWNRATIELLWLPLERYSFIHSNSNDISFFSNYCLQNDNNSRYICIILIQHFDMASKISTIPLEQSLLNGCLWTKAIEGYDYFVGLFWKKNHIRLIRIDLY